jgi:endonuclease III
MNLYLRWMIRRTSPDLGLWAFADPAKLVMPVDTHIHRIAHFLGLSDRKSADWKSARIITDALARFDASDPVRYDFALCRLGILDLCSRRRRKENCDVCTLRDACRFPVLKSNRLDKNSRSAAPRQIAAR